MGKNGRGKTSTSSTTTEPTGCSSVTDSPSAETKTKSQIKRMKKREKRKKREAEKILKEVENVLPEEEWEILEEVVRGGGAVEMDTARMLDEAVCVSEVMVLDGQEDKKPAIINPEEEENLRQFLKTLDIPESNDKADDLYENVIFSNNKPVITIPDEIFEEFMESEEINQTKETIKNLGVVTKTSPKFKRRESSPTKLNTKIVEPAPKLLYSYSGLPIVTPNMVRMEDLDDSVIVVHCGEDRGFEPMDIIFEEGSELSDTSSDKKRFSGISEISFGGYEPCTKETVIISQQCQNLPKVVVSEGLAEERQDGVEVVFLDDDSDGNTTPAVSYEGIRFIEEGSESSHAGDDYEADVESAVESRRDTVILDSQEEADEEEQEERAAEKDETVAVKKSPVNSRENSSSSGASNSANTAKYLPPYSRSESEADEWKSAWKSEEISQEIGEIGKCVSVHELRKNLERDIHPILISKLTMMEFFDDPTLHEKTWNKVVENTRKTLQNKKSFKNKEVQTIINPASLVVLAKEALLALPNGLFLSRKIGISLSCPSSPPQMPKSPYRRYSDTETCSELQFYNTMPSDPSVVEFSCPDSRQEDSWWYGMPTQDPSLYVGLSPSQIKEFSNSQKHSIPTQQEAENLLDLHQKFIERRSYSETNPFQRGRNLVFDSSKHMMNDTAPSEHVSAQERGPADVGGGKMEEGSRDFAIKSRGSEETGAAAKPCVLAARQNATPYDRCAANAAADLKRNASGAADAGARRGHEVSAMDARPSERKQATASLQACPESARPSDQSGVARTIFDRFMNNGEGLTQDKKDSALRLKVYEGNQVQTGGGPTPVDDTIVTERLPSVSDVIKAFEAPIDGPDSKKARKEESLESLLRKEEKQSSYIVDNYVISKNRDIAVIHNEERRRSLTHEELFKQQMYDEYMSKLAERVERRQQNSIKISNQQNSAPECKTQGIEQEFISKVRERQDRSVSSEDSLTGPVQKNEHREDQHNSKRSSVVVDLCADFAGLPKHLQEFLSLQQQRGTDDNNEPLDTSGESLSEITATSFKISPGVLCFVFW